MWCTQEAPGKAKKELRDQAVGLFFFDEDSERFIPGIEARSITFGLSAMKIPGFGSLIMEKLGLGISGKRSSSAL